MKSVTLLYFRYLLLYPFEIKEWIIKPDKHLPVNHIYCKKRK